MLKAQGQQYFDCTKLDLAVGVTDSPHPAAPQNNRMDQMSWVAQMDRRDQQQGGQRGRYYRLINDHL